jgi:glucose/arabinose dehydrogenase
MPVVTFDAHSAPLGLAFYTGTQFPEGHRGDAFVAQHGSWNRSTPIGYRVMRVRFENNEAVGAEVFASGWLQQDGDFWGRPVDVTMHPRGALLVSDDETGTLYRISYRGGNSEDAGPP